MSKFFEVQRFILGKEYDDIGESSITGFSKVGQKESGCSADILKFANSRLESSYWEKFYKSRDVSRLNKHSDFANFFLNTIKASYHNKQLLQELGCGNGRDTYYFIENGINVIAVDAYASDKGNGFIKGDAIENVVPADYYYMRFFTHAVPEAYLDELLLKISCNANKNALIFIETRSTKDVTGDQKSIVEFTSAIGDKHARYLYSKEYFSCKLQSNFDVILIEESKGLAVFGNEDPWIIRTVVKPIAVS